MGKLPSGTKFDPLKEKVRALVKLANFKSQEAGDENERLTRVFRAHEQLTNMLIGMIDERRSSSTAWSEIASCTWPPKSA